MSQGVFSTGVIVMEGSDEFVVDFFQGLDRPPRVATRVVVSPNVMSQFVAALKENLQRYEQSFGPPKSLPTPPSGEHHPSVQDIYHDLRLPDEYVERQLRQHGDDRPLAVGVLLRLHHPGLPHGRRLRPGLRGGLAGAAGAQRAEHALKNRTNREAEAKKNPPPNAAAKTSSSYR